MKPISSATKLFSLFVISLLICDPLFAQVPPDSEDPLNAPIDGGVSLLVAAGVAYGAKKAHAARKKQKDMEK